MNAPESIEGWQVWDLVLRSSSQMRVTQGGVLGFDMVAVYATGAALGVPPALIAEIVPELEAKIVRKLNDSIRGESGG